MSRRNSRKSRQKAPKKLIQRLLMVVGVLAFMALFGLGLAAVDLFYLNSVYGPAAEKYASASGLAILTARSPEELESVLQPRLTPEAKADFTKAGISHMVAALNSLGKFGTYKGIVFTSITRRQMSPAYGSGPYFTYTASAVFEKGTGSVKMTLIHHNDDWQMTGAYITTTTNPS